MLDARKKLQAVIFLFENIDQVIFDINKRQVSKDLIIFYNTIDQLFVKGENSLGQTLESIRGGYSPATITIKIAKNQPTDHITLKDTGEFYDSWTVVVKINEIEILANPIKPGGTNLFEEWGDEIVGLNEENLEKYRQYLKRVLLSVIRASLAGIA